MTDIRIIGDGLAGYQLGVLEAINYDDMLTKVFDAMSDNWVPIGAAVGDVDTGYMYLKCKRNLIKR
ncbi:MAG TPA: hypothetical protein EYG72_02410 [Candidatus Pacebacteria bacterium]|nr:hypothetical protein [Candidatus Paceibacterota bacterium]